MVSPFQPPPLSLRRRHTVNIDRLTTPWLRASTRLVAIASLGFAVALTTVVISGEHNDRQQQDGQQIFRFDTFGDEQLWTNVLRMHEAISTIDPTTALGV